MIAAALLLALTLSGADDLTATTVEGLQLKVPAAWKRTDGEKGNVRFDAPNPGASFELSVFPVAPRREGALCVDQLLKALKGPKWTRDTVGGAPAAWNSVDEAAPAVGEGGEKAAPVQVRTNSYVGCNGATKWVLTVTLSSKGQARYEALARKIVASIAYPK